MTALYQAILFLFGLAIGSFLDVLASRYQPDVFLFSKKIIGGRSHCPYCGETLKWYELIPVFSFLWQRGRCLHCGHRLSFEYPLVEILSGLIFILVPTGLVHLNYYGYSLPLAILWTLFFLVLLLISLIDFRLNLIPDELNIFLAFIGFLIAFFNARFFNAGNWQGSLISSYALIFGFHGDAITNRLAALVFVVLFYGLIIFGGRGRLMGLGDLKLALGLALAFGWPEVAILTALAFIIGSIVGLVLIILKKKTMKNFLPFAPFLALGGALVFFYGYQIIYWYFALFNIRL